MFSLPCFRIGPWSKGSLGEWWTPHPRIHSPLPGFTLTFEACLALLPCWNSPLTGSVFLLCPETRLIPLSTSLLVYAPCGFQYQINLGLSSGFSSHGLWNVSWPPASLFSAASSDDYFPILECFADWCGLSENACLLSLSRAPSRVWPKDRYSCLLNFSSLRFCILQRLWLALIISQVECES